MAAGGRYRLERVLALSDVSEPLRCECLLVLSWVTLLQATTIRPCSTWPTPESWADSSGGIAGSWRRYPPGPGGLHRLFSGRPAEGVPLYRRGITVLREVGDLGAMVTAMFQLALCEMFSDDADAATATCTEILTISERTGGEAWTKAYAL